MTTGRPDWQTAMAVLSQPGMSLLPVTLSGEVAAGTYEDIEITVPAGTVGELRGLAVGCRQTDGTGLATPWALALYSNATAAPAPPVDFNETGMLWMLWVCTSLFQGGFLSAGEVIAYGNDPMTEVRPEVMVPETLDALRWVLGSVVVTPDMPLWLRIDALGLETVGTAKLEYQIKAVLLLTEVG